MSVDLDVRSTSPIASRSEVSHLLDVSGQKLYAWSRPAKSGAALIHTRKVASTRLTFPLVGIAEASALNALRVSGLSMQQIRGAAEFIRAEHGEEFALASPKFVTDGTDAFIQDHLGLTRMKDRQTTIRETVKDHLRPLVIGPDGFVEAFRVDRFSSEVTIDPRFNAGQMSFVTNRVPLFAISGPLIAGESEQLLIQDFGLTKEQLRDVRENLRWLSFFG